LLKFFAYEQIGRVEMRPRRMPLHERLFRDACPGGAPRIASEANAMMQHENLQHVRKIDAGCDLTEI
jgi:hypothetical protein